MAYDKRYIEGIAETANDLLSKGVADPSAIEITEAHFPDHTALGNEVEMGISRRLPRIRDVLRADYGQEVYLVNAAYYKSFRRKMPITIEDARHCIPIGRGVTPAGLRLLSGDDDLIWRATVTQNSNSGGAKLKKSLDRVVRAYEREAISKDLAAELIVEAGKHASPDKPEIVARALAQVETPADDKLELGSGEE